MQVNDILPHFNLDRMTARTFLDLCDRLERESPPQGEFDSHSMVALYGDQLHDLAIHQAQLDAAKTKAEIARLGAQVQKDHSEAVAASASSSSAKGS